MDEKPDIPEIVERYGSDLFAFIRKRISSDEDAEDILQDIWFQLSKTYNTEPVRHISGWLYAVARNKVIDKYRRHMPRVSEKDFYNDEGNIFFDQLLFDNSNPENEYLKNVFWETLFTALDDLPLNQREVFIKNELEGKTLNEIAEEQHINLKTIISRKRYAVQYLRKAMQFLHDDFID
jgi:RNA polymerase sigma factor (sigma-70 family)